MENPEKMSLNDRTGGTGLSPLQKSKPLSPEKSLHKKFVRLGKDRRKLGYELLTMLPEIDRLHIWEKEGFQSLAHYAKILGGLSEAVVHKTMQVAKKVEDKPNLKAAIGIEGIHKVALVATVATSENEKMLADFVQGANKDAVLEYARELREKQNLHSGRNVEDGQQMRIVADHGSGCGVQDGEIENLRKCRAVQKISIDLDNEMQYLFLKLKRKYGEKLSNKEVLRRILCEMIELKFAEKKQSDGSRADAKIPAYTKQQNLKIVQDFPAAPAVGVGKISSAMPALRENYDIASESDSADEEINPIQISELEILYFSNSGYENSPIECAKPLDAPLPRKTDGQGGHVSRRTYIKKSIRTAALAKTNNRCAYANCNKPYKVLHHIERWAKSRSHANIIPLCKEHHAFMHNGLIDEQNLTIRETANLGREDLRYLEIRNRIAKG
ncbi:HNH endonuclease [Candidatus Peregrinibacteria bacterium]|nr:HNH endonuclease [Candidatus Peregrinibacteria bacterium]